MKNSTLNQTQAFSLKPLRKMFSNGVSWFTLCAAFTAYAQTPSMVHWSCMPPDSQHVSSVSGNVQGYDQSSSPGFVVRDYNNGPGPDQRWWPYENGAAVAWGEETQQVETRWVQFSVSPSGGFTLQADSLHIRLGAKGTNNMRANVVLALDPDFAVTANLNSAPIELIADSDELFHWGLFSAQVPDGGVLYVRIYPWYQGAPSTSKYLYVRDASITGFSQGLVYPASAAWDLSDPDQGGTGGSVSLTGPLGGEDQDLEGLEVMGYGGPNLSQLLNISDNSWPADQLELLENVYAEFSITAQPGNRFTSSQVALTLSAVATHSLKAQVFSSLNPDFSGPVELNYSTSDPSGNNLLIQDSLHVLAENLVQTLEPGQTLSLRVYPWVHGAGETTTDAFLALQNIQVTGTVETVPIIYLPSVTTDDVTYISTSFCSSGGTVSNDGGAPVTLRGVCWNNTGTPVYSDAHTSDGEGGGAFISQPQDLIPGTSYFLRAYAMNSAGVAYGEEQSFNTLAFISPPGVATSSVSNILVQTAQSGGTVYDWGGAEVTTRGICWNTSGNPGIEDSHSESGAGLGTFTALMIGLEAETSYSVRAYAVNAAGIGYGNELSFTTQAPAPTVFKTVAQDGSGDYLTVQAAFDAVPDYYTGAYNIFVAPGIYHEKLLLDRAKINVILRGESAANTILTYDDYAGIAGGTSMSYSVAIDADDFTAIDITFQNTVQNDGSFGDQQAVALRVNGDRQAYYNCRLEGYQDTYYTWGGRGTGRIYMKNCWIQGSVDFIFGRDIVVFDSCQIHINRNGGTLTAAATEVESQFGYVFLDCEITAEEIGFDDVPVTSFLLGRPWQAAPRTVFLRCEEPATLSAAGWAAWNVPPALYAEYQCTGPGSDYANRHPSSRQLSDEEAVQYTLTQIFARSSHPAFSFDWMPPATAATLEVQDRQPQQPSVFNLDQNYPNPFNPITQISYSLPHTTAVELTLYDLRGAQQRILVQSTQEAGVYEVQVDASSLPSGIYFYRLSTPGFSQTRKMTILK